MSLTWLHLSDFHLSPKDPYDREVVSNALVESVAQDVKRGRKPDVIFATGDIAYSGQENEYKLATPFFDALLKAAELDKRRLFVIPGNHDVDRSLGIGLARTLSSRDEADAYFDQDAPQLHLQWKLRAFRNWYDQYFEGIRVHPRTSTCGPIESFEAGGIRLGIFPILSSLFCKGGDDHEKLFVGRRCLDAALDRLASLKADLNVALIHHPVSWLNPIEREHVRARIQERMDFVLRGHLHEAESEGIQTAEGRALHLAAGAFYDRGGLIQRASYVSLEDGNGVIRPIQYSERPIPAWVLDAGRYPHEPTGERKFSLAHGLESNRGHSVPQSLPATSWNESRRSGIRTNIPDLGEQLFAGREYLLEEIASVFANPSRPCQLVLRGIPGVGKSELAREYARRKQDRYPGGTFIIDFSEFSAGCPIDLAQVGETSLGLTFIEASNLSARCKKALHELFASPSLLIYDNVLEEGHLEGWLPLVGAPCHVLITTILDRWSGGPREILVEPLTEAESKDLVVKIGGSLVAEKYGQLLVDAAAGLPVQLVPTVRRVAHEEKRGRTASIERTLTSEALGGFKGTIDRLDSGARRFLQAAAFLTPQRIPRSEIESLLQSAFGCTYPELQAAISQCLDFSVLKGNDLLQMNPLIATYVRNVKFEGTQQEFEQLCRIRSGRFADLAREISSSPLDTTRSTVFLAYPVDIAIWKENAPASMPDVDAVASALLKVELFEDAYRWYGLGIEIFLESRAMDIAELEPQALLRLSDRRHQMGFCLSRLGRFDEAVGHFQGAIEAVRQIPVMTERAFDGLARSLAELGRCFLQSGRFDDARESFEAILSREIADHAERSRLGWLKSEVGQWYRGAGEVGLAKDWLERAIEDSRQVQPADHDQIGYIYHQVGLCYTSSKRDDEAQMAMDSFERAIAELGKGDGSGQVNFQHLSISLHQLGCCLASLKRSDEAIVYFERAMGAALKGDPGGQVNQAQLGEILYMMGQSYMETSLDSRGALRWFRESVEAKRKGDLLGRVDRESLRLSLEAAGRCHSKLGEEGEALRLEAEAAALESSGDPV